MHALLETTTLNRDLEGEAMRTQNVFHQLVPFCDFDMIIVIAHDEHNQRSEEYRRNSCRTAYSELLDSECYRTT